MKQIVSINLHCNFFILFKHKCLRRKKIQTCFTLNLGCKLFSQLFLEKENICYFKSSYEGIFMPVLKKKKKKSFILMQIKFSLTLVLSGVLNLFCLYCHFDSVILKCVAFASEGSRITISYL